MIRTDILNCVSTIIHICRTGHAPSIVASLRSLAIRREAEVHCRTAAVVVATELHGRIHSKGTHHAGWSAVACTYCRYAKNGYILYNFRMLSKWSKIDALVTVMFIVAIVLRAYPIVTNDDARYVKVDRVLAGNVRRWSGIYLTDHIRIRARTAIHIVDAFVLHVQGTRPEDSHDPRDGEHVSCWDTFNCRVCSWKSYPSSYCSSWYF